MDGDALYSDRLEGDGFGDAGYGGGSYGCRDGCQESPSLVKRLGNGVAD